MKKSLLLISSLLAAGTLGAWAANYPLSTETTAIATTTASNDSTTTGSGDVFTVSGDSNYQVDGILQLGTAGWGGTYVKDSFLGTVEGTGTLEMFMKGGDGGKTYELTLATSTTGADFSGFSGQLSVVNDWNRPLIVHVYGDTFSNVEYIFGTVSREKNWSVYAGVGAVDTYTLALSGDTTFAGITGTSKTYSDLSFGNLNSKEAITATTAGDTLKTTTSTGEYAFYGTVGASGTEVSLKHTGAGTQTYGGTNHLKDVTVSAGVLNLEGVTTITGTAKATDTGTLNVAGTLTIADGASIDLSTSKVALDSTVDNSGTITISSATKFVLDDLTGTLDSSASTFTYQLIAPNATTAGTVTTTGTLDLSQFTIAGNELNDRWTITNDGSNLFVTSNVTTLTYASGDWNTTSKTTFTDPLINPTKFADGDSVIFGTSGASVGVFGTHVANVLELKASTTFTGTGNVSASSVTIADSQTLTWSAGTLTVDLDNITLGTDSKISLGEGAVLDVGILPYVPGATEDADPLKQGVTLTNISSTTTGAGTILLEIEKGYNKAKPINLASCTDFTGTVILKGGTYSGTSMSLGSNTLGTIYSSDINTSTFGSSATLVLDGSIAVADGSETISAPVVVRGQHIYFWVNSNKTFTFSKSVDVESGAQLIVGNGNADITGTLTGSGTINVVSGALKVTGTSATHSFSGTVNINGGTFLLGNDGNSTANVTMNSAAVFNVNSGTLLLNMGGGAVTSRREFGNNIMISSGASLQLKDGYIKLSGNIAFDGTNTTAISVSQLWGKNHDFSGVLSGKGLVELTCASSGENQTVTHNHVFTISGGSNTFTGTYSLVSHETAGEYLYTTLNVANTNAIKGASVIVGDNSRLQLSVASANMNDLSGTGTITLDSSVSAATLTVDSISGTNTSIAVSAGLTVEILKSMAEAATLEGATGASVIAKTGTLGNISVAGTNATVTLTESVTQGVITLTDDAKIVIADKFTSSDEISQISSNALTASVDQTETINIIAASALVASSVDWSSLDTSDWATYFDYNEEIYQEALFSVDSNGIIVMTYAIPEPSMFGLLAGTLALALAGTRRRRKATK